MLPEATQRFSVLCPELKPKLLRVFRILCDRGVYAQEFLKRVEPVLSGATAKSPTAAIPSPRTKVATTPTVSSESTSFPNPPETLLEGLQTAHSRCALIDHFKVVASEVRPDLLDGTLDCANVRDKRAMKATISEAMSVFMKYLVRL